MADSNITSLKACSKCGREKADTIGYFRSYKSAGRELLRKRCRLCEGLKQEGIVLPGRLSSAMPKEEAAKRNRDRCRAYYAANKEKQQARYRAERIANPEKIRARDRYYYQKNKSAKSEYQKRRWARKDKEAARVALREWRRLNPDKDYAIWRRKYLKYRDKILAYRKQWARDNPEARMAIRDRRRARLMGAEGSYTRADVRALLKRYGRSCFYCGVPLTKFHCDHFIPLVRGGSNSPDNLRLSCPSCNFSKAGRMPWDWKPDRFSAP